MEQAKATSPESLPASKAKKVWHPVFSDPLYMFTVGTVINIVKKEDLDNIPEAEHEELREIQEMFESDPGLRDKIVSLLVTIKNLSKEVTGLHESYEDKFYKKEGGKAVKKAASELSDEEKEEQQFDQETIKEATAELEAALQSLKKEAQNQPDKELYLKYLKLESAIINIYENSVLPLKDESQKLAKQKVQNIIARKDASQLKKFDVVAGFDRKIDKINGKIKTVTEELDELIQGKGYIELQNVDYTVELLRLREQLEQGRFVETENNKESIGFIMECLRMNHPLMIVGGYGSGKTESARHCVKKYLIEKGIIKPEEYEATHVLLFSGSKETSVYDLLGKLKIGHKHLTLAQRFELFKKEVAELNKQLPSDKQIKLDDLDSMELLKLGLQGTNPDITETQIAMGTIAKGIEEDRPVIIDEVNQIPEDTLSRIRDILTRKPGDTIDIPEIGINNLTIGKNFCIIFTANLKSEKHKQREELDSATASRAFFYEYPYLNKEDSYSLILAKFLNLETGTLNPRLPHDDFMKFTDLVCAIAEIQAVYGKKFELSAAGAAGGAAHGKKMELKDINFSPRHLLDILNYWEESSALKAGGLDEAIARSFLAQAVINKEEQQYVTEILLRFGFFDKWTAEDFNKIGIAISKDFLATVRAILIDPATTANDQFLQEARTLKNRSLSTASHFGLFSEDLAKDKGTLGRLDILLPQLTVLLKIQEDLLASAEEAKLIATGKKKLESAEAAELTKKVKADFEQRIKVDTDGNVIEMDLSNLQITKVPLALKQLGKLQKLDCSNLQFKPEETASLSAKQLKEYQQQEIQKLKKMFKFAKV